jgi:hypothetical protein
MRSSSDWVFLRVEPSSQDLEGCLLFVGAVGTPGLVDGGHPAATPAVEDHPATDGSAGRQVRISRHPEGRADQRFGWRVRPPVRGGGVGDQSAQEHPDRRVGAFAIGHERGALVGRQVER